MRLPVPPGSHAVYVLSEMFQALAAGLCELLQLPLPRVLDISLHFGRLCRRGLQLAAHVRPSCKHYRCVLAGAAF